MINELLWAFEQDYVPLLPGESEDERSKRVEARWITRHELRHVRLHRVRHRGPALLQHAADAAVVRAAVDVFRSVVVDVAVRLRRRQGARALPRDGRLRL